MDFSIAGAFEHFTAATWIIATTLLIMSVLSVGVALNRALYFMKSRKQSLAFAGAVGGLLTKANVVGIVNTSEEEGYKFSYLARIVRDGLVDAQDLKTKGQLDDLSTVSSAMERAVTEEAGLMKKWMTVLATVASSAPFVGLLGTVFGIISSTTEPFCRQCDRSRLTADGVWYRCLYAHAGTDLREPLRAGADAEGLRSLISSTWAARDDRGAEDRLASDDRSALIPIETLQNQPHLEMHTRGG